MAKPRITIVGLGLVGGSLGLALHQVKADFEIVGHDKEPAVANQARKLGAIDRVEWNLIAACEPADLVFLATPILAIKDILATVAPYLKPGAIVTDTATTKQQVMGWAAQSLPAGVSFIGGDPLVGAAQAGLEGASAGLFTNALYCLIPLPGARPDSVRLLADLVALIGARPYFIDAVEHDGLAAGISHLPFVLSTVLLRTVSSSAAWRDMINMASYDFRQATALADVDPAIHRDICLTNSAGIVRWIDALMESLAALRTAVAAGDAAQVEQLFSQVHATRGELLHGPRQDSQLAEELDRMSRNRLRQMFLGSGGRRRNVS
jgi:prephenate dehydrogenase